MNCDKLSELKEKQTEIGDKISLLQATNKKKDEEAAEIRQLIAECRENLNRIKGLSPNENLTSPCENLDVDLGEFKNSDGEGNCQEQIQENNCEESTRRGNCEELNKRGNCDRFKKRGKCQESSRKGNCGACSSKKGKCDEILASKSQGSCNSKKKKGTKETVSCRVDLNRMKVRIRGPSEDLKRLDATQLICLLERFKCQELIINTGEETLQDPGEIRLVYFLHPGNIVMIIGIVMIAFLINTNVCHADSSSKKLFLRVLYVCVTAFHYGMVLWMIFIRGYALRFGLNHDLYHLVDNLILPKYFGVCVLLGALSLYSFLATNSICPCSSWPMEVVAQITIVVVLFFMELITICYIVPALIRLRRATDDYIFDDEDECDAPRSYGKNLIKLGKLGWTLCLINFLTFALLCANIYFITSKLSNSN